MCCFFSNFKKCGGGDFFCGVWFKIGKFDFTFIREMRVDSVGQF